MKNMLFSFFLILFCLHTYSQTTEKSLALYGSARLVLEKPIDNYSTLSIIPSVGILNTRDVNYMLFGIGTEYRCYFTGTAPMGLYSGIGFGYSFGNARIVNEILSGYNLKTDAGGFLAHLVIGRQWIFENGLLLNVNIGAHYLNLGFKQGAADFSSVKAFNGVMPGIGFCIGFRLKSSSCDR